MAHQTAPLQNLSGIHGQKVKPQPLGTTADPAPDFLDRLTAVVHSGRSFSWQAVAISIVSLTLATVLRAAFGSAAAHFPLTFYVIAILVVEVLTGLPVAIATAVASMLIVWWAFIPPYFQFAGPDVANLPLEGLFLTEAGLAILVGFWCRVALIRLHQHQVAYRTVARELVHRNKNSRAVFEVIVRKSLQHDREGADTILGRVRALGYADDLLINSAAECVSLESLLIHEFAPYGPDRLRVDGPLVELPASKARHLLLIFHELATNAAKYGALSNDEGRVDVSWQVENRTVLLQWAESGGPIVKPPEREGFGSALLQQSAAALAGNMRSSFCSDGFKCTLKFQP